MIRLEMRMSLAEKTNTATTGDYQILLRFQSGVGVYTDIGFKTSALLDGEWTTIGFYNLESTWQAETGGGVDWSAVADVAIFVNALNSASAFRVRGMTFEPVGTVDQADEAVQWVMDELTADLDSTTNHDTTSWADVRTELGGQQFSMDLRQAGETFGSVLARIGYENRTNIVPNDFGSDTVYKAYLWDRNSSSGAHWPASVLEIEDSRAVIVETKQIDEMPTDFVVLWDHESYLGANAIDAFRGTLRYNADGCSTSEITTGEITTAQTAVGQRLAEPIALLAQETEANASDIATYYIEEMLAQKRYRLSLEVPIATGYGLEPGDIVQWTVPWGVASPLRDFRVVQVVWAWNEPVISLNLEEVER